MHQHQQVESNEPRKDHYSYSYSYKTSDPESGQPGLAQVEVNESVTEEVGPDGSKIIRRHQQEKQVNKITQVKARRYSKRISSVVLLFYCLLEQFCEVGKSKVSLF